MEHCLISIVYLLFLCALCVSANISSEVLLVIGGKLSLLTYSTVSETKIPVLYLKTYARTQYIIFTIKSICSLIFFQYPDIVLVHYLNIPDRKTTFDDLVTSLLPYKTLTENELFCQLQPICKSSCFKALSVTIFSIF